MDQSIHIWAHPDGSRATMSIYSKDVSRDDVDKEIGFENIVNGICNDEIDGALKKLHETGSPQHNILIAKAEINPDILHYGNQQTVATIDDLRKIVESSRFAGITLENMKDGKVIHDKVETIFVIRDQKFCTITFPEFSKDIFGRQIHNTHHPGLSFTFDGSIMQNRTENGLEYVSKKDGYLVSLSSGQLSVADPFSTNTTKMCFLYHIIPVLWNNNALLDHFWKVSDQKIHSDIKQVAHSKEEIQTVITSGKCASIVLRFGRDAINGKNGELTLLVQNSTLFHERKDGSVDFKENSRFQQIKAGTLLTEIVRPVPGTIGINVLGERINVEQPVEINFSPGKNVIQKENNGKISFIAACDGILNLQENMVEILDALTISGDIGFQTGNIHSEKDVYISGNVLAGFSIECQGSLIIDGCLENGSTLYAKGNCTIRQGIFGNKTKVTIKGNADVGFVQDSNLIVEGNLHVKKFIYNSHILCGNQLSVDGAGIENDHRGSVLGGKVIAMHNMVLSSAGCEGENTFLYCGINPDVKSIIENLKGKGTTLNKKVTMLRSSLNINLNASDIKERLQALLPNEKERAKKILLALKVLSQEQMSISEQLSNLEKVEKFNRPELCSIEIKKHIFPDTTVTFCNESKLITNKSNKCVLKGDQNGGIIIS